MSPLHRCTAWPDGLRHWSRRSVTWTAAGWFGSIHWYENASLRPRAGTNRVLPGLLTSVCAPTFVLITRNSTGAPETSAPTPIWIGKIDEGESTSPGILLNVLELVVNSPDRHRVSMHLTGVVPPLLFANAAHPATVTSATAAATLAVRIHRIADPPPSGRVSRRNDVPRSVRVDSAGPKSDATRPNQASTSSIVPGRASSEARLFLAASSTWIRGGGGRWSAYHVPGPYRRPHRTTTPPASSTARSISRTATPSSPSRGHATLNATTRSTPVEAAASMSERDPSRLILAFAPERFPPPPPISSGRSLKALNRISGRAALTALGMAGS